MPGSFRLARVLRLRTQLRERAQVEVGAVRAALTSVSERLEVVRAAQAASRAAEAAVAATGMTAGDLQRFRGYEQAQRVREQALVAEGAELTATLAARREVLIERRRDERQLELLRERARERDETAEERSAMTLLDELAVRRRGERR
jgi:flagellar export protein FliJ